MKYTSFNKRYQDAMAQGNLKLSDQSVIIARMEADRAGRAAKIHDLQHRICVLEIHVAKQLKARDELVVDLQCIKTKKCVKLLPVIDQSKDAQQQEYLVNVEWKKEKVKEME